MKNALLAFLLLFCTPVISLLAQESAGTHPVELFKDSGEIYFTFDIGFPQELEVLTRIISIDNVKGTQVFAYANLKEFRRFLEFGYSYTVLPHPGSLLDESEIRPSGTGQGTLTTWNYYPNYLEYINLMNGFEINYPDLCKVVSIGTSVLGRELLAIKISDNVNDSEGEPEVLYTSSIHGDELTGYVTMLHLIDYLLQHYGSDPRISEMVDNTEIFINPLANPDGTFYGGNTNISQARRYNANWVDLNRNYPDPQDGPHPDGNVWQNETVAFMAFADSNHFVIGANFHGGAEVFNYPWDTWPKLAADDDWWRFVGHEYADTAQEYGPPGYFTGVRSSGIVNGYQWYTISGGRQDYMNYWHSDREVTLEISNNKFPPASQLLNYWEYNYRSLLNYIEQANYGVQGVVTDSVTGEPLLAGVFIPGHDIDHSDITTKLPSGSYFRLLNEGTYDIEFSSQGYFPKIIQGVEVVNMTTTHLDVALVPLNVGKEDPLHAHVTMAYPNPSDGRIDLLLPETGTQEALIECFDMTGRRNVSRTIVISPGMTSVKLNLEDLSSGLYLIKLTIGPASYTDRLIIR
ncbi:MAG: T9SS C-terminal target domain-containing protein [Bacteroidetes bacterium]|nr:MAG: T9SS C-terminal target domain-containing protein [Bacteroidota bacterium]